MDLSFFKTRRFRLLVSLLTAFAAIFLITGQYRSIPTSKGKVITVGVFSDSYWDVQNGYAYKILDDAIEKFERAHPDVKVEYVSGIMKADYSEWLSERMMNDAMPDVFFILPFECAPNMMFVNKTILDREKIELPDRNWTWDDFYAICRRATRDTHGTGVIDQFGEVSYTWKDAFDANGVVLFDEKGKNCDFTVKEIGDAITFLEKLNGLDSGYAVSERNFSQGNVVFQPMLFSEYRAYKSQELSIKKYSGFEWECLTMPAGPSGDNYSRLDTLSIAMSEQTTEKEYAWAFIKLLTSDREIQSEIFDYSAGISVLPEVTNSDETRRRITQSTGTPFNMSVLESAMEKTVTRTRFRGYDNALEEVGIAVSSILDSRSNIQMEQIIWNRTINNYLKTLSRDE